MITSTNIEVRLGEFRRYLEERKHAPRTVNTYYITVRRFLKTDPWADEYTYKDIVDYFGRLSKTKLCQTSKFGMLVAMRRYYEFLLNKGYRNDHPCWRFFLKGGRRRGMIASDFLSMEELEQLMNRKEGWGKQPMRNKLILSMYIYQGLCTKEITNLNLTDVDLDNGTIKIKGDRRRNARELQLHPMQHDLINDYLKWERKGVMKHYSPKSAFILNQYGYASSHDSIYDSLLPVVEVFGKKTMNAITIRQSVMAHWMNVMKIPLEQVQLMAGIKHASSIERYYHLSKNEQQDVLKKFHPMG
jgi:site-specific recombinase XerD